MRVIVMASQKGGSGKTTLSGHLAVEAERAGGGPVTLIDTDPQGSLSQWWNARKATMPHFTKVGLGDLSDALAHLAKSGFALAVIDTPPAITAAITQVVAHADLVIVPTRPSPHDLRAVGATVDIAERHGKPLIFVINAATARARITGESAVALSQHGTVAPVTVHHRVDFAASMVDGRTVGEIVANSPSAREIRDLWIYLHDRLARLRPDAGALPERPAHFAVNSLSPWPDPPTPPAARLLEEEEQAGAAAAGDGMAAEPNVQHSPASIPDYGAVRRDTDGSRAAPRPFGGGEARPAFGRRASERSMHLAARPSGRFALPGPDGE